MSDSAQEPSLGGYTRNTLGGDLRGAGRRHPHGAELDQGEGPATDTHPLLPVEHRPSRAHSHQQGAHEEQGRQQDQDHAGQYYLDAVRDAGGSDARRRLDQVHHRPAEQVADAAHAHAAFEQVGQARDDPHPDWDRLAQLDDALDVEPRGVGHGDQDVIDAEFPDQRPEIGGGADDRHTVQDRALLARVVVDEALDLEIGAPQATDVVGGGLAGPAGADQQNRPCIAPVE